MANPVGRPTEYKEDYPKKVLSYLVTCGREQTKLPKRVDIALLLECHKETLIEWAKIHPEFSDALMRVDMTQEGQLIDDGIYGGKEVNPPVIKLLLSNHGYKEVTREEHTGKDGSPLVFQVQRGDDSTSERVLPDTPTPNTENSAG